MNPLIVLVIVIVIILAVAGALWVRGDYRAWLALGKGGLPANLGGWLRTTGFRIRKAPTTTTERYAPAIGVAGDLAALHDLPHRNGPRPTFAPWPVPHRQTDQFIGTEMRLAVEALFERVVNEHPEELEFSLSFYEKRHRAITSRHPEKGPEVARITHGEIAHVHPSDGSIHLILSPSDATSAIEAGWAERHPMAGVGDALPDLYLAVYPPRDAVELAAVATLLDASVRYMTGAA